METSRYLDCLAQDYALLRSAAASAGPDAAVPSCPGWTMADLASHVGQTYLHKAVIMRDGKFPDPWPPAEHASEQPLTLLDEGYRELTAEFAARSPDEPTPTWHGPDQTVAFWIRRMAQETAVHRMDAQLAAGVPVARVPDDLAADGVDEVLTVMLAYDPVRYPAEYAALEGGHLAAPGGTDTIVVTAGRQAWTVRPTPTSMTVTGGRSGGARAEVAAGPDAMLRWLWGRAGDDALSVAGDREWVAYLRRMVTAATG